MTSSFVPLDAIECDFNELRDAVAVARTTVEAGELVDLAGMERRVDALCANLQRHPVDQALRLQQDLVGLIDDLSALAEALALQRERFAQPEAGAEGRSAKSATRAYERSRRGGE